MKSRRKLIKWKNIKFKENLIDIYFGNEQVVEKGKINGFDKKKVKQIMENNSLKIIIDLNQGKEYATAYGCDMSYDYIKINALYTT